MRHPNPGEVWRAASGGVRVVCGLTTDRTGVFWRHEGEGELVLTSLWAWNLWQRSAVKLEKVKP